MKTFCNIHTHVKGFSEETESLLDEACCRAVDFLQNTWSLKIPTCHVYVTARWQTIMLEQPPTLYRKLYKVGLSILRRRRDALGRLWDRSAGWFQRYGNLCFIAIKPLSDFQKMNLKNSPLYAPMNAKEKFCNTLVHELTHAFTAHLKLPLCLNEGIALLAAERALGYGAVRIETLEYLTKPRRDSSYYQLPKLEGETFLYHYAKGYWLIRYLQEQHEEVLKQLLSKWKLNSIINRNINKLFNNRTSDSILYSYFKDRLLLDGPETQQGVVALETQCNLQS
jgi:hypothetical protein